MKITSLGKFFHREVLYIVASVGGKEGEYRFDGAYEDILYGDIYKNSVKLNPYDLHILRRIK